MGLKLLAIKIRNEIDIIYKKYEDADIILFDTRYGKFIEFPKDLI